MREWRRLTPEQQRRFQIAWKTIVQALKSQQGLPPPPVVQKMSGVDIYEVRWAADGRATFHIEMDVVGEPIIIWRRIGDHSILKQP